MNASLDADCVHSMCAHTQTQIHPSLHVLPLNISAAPCIHTGIHECKHGLRGLKDRGLKIDRGLGLGFENHRLFNS